MRQGLSLVEVMCCLTLLVTGLTSVFESMAMAQRTSQKAKYRNLALAAIQAQIEVFQAMDQTAFNTVVANGTIAFPVEGLPGTGGSAPAGEIVPMTVTGRTSQRTCLRFSVRWKEISGPDGISITYHYVPRI